MWFKESESPSFSRVLLHLIHELLEEWQLLILDLLEPGHVQLSYLGGGHPIYHTKGLVRGILLVIGRCDHLAELQLYDVVYLCLRHQYIKQPDCRQEPWRPRCHYPKWSRNRF